MKYTVAFKPQAIKELKKMNKSSSALIHAWIKKNLENCENPFQFGKGLVANHHGEWRYRVGDYRIIANIQQDKIIILILNVGHRKDIYKNH